MTDSNHRTGGTERYEVVIGADGEMEEEHAELVKRQLTRDDFHEHAVQVRPVQAGTEDDRDV